MHLAHEHAARQAPHQILCDTATRVAAMIRSTVAVEPEGDLEPIDLSVTDYARMAQLVDKYDDFPLGPRDASVIAIAERLGVPRSRPCIGATSAAIRPAHILHITLVPGQE